MNRDKTLVRKRDGMEVLFNPEKINVSVSKALLESARIKGTNLSLEDMEMAAQISMAVQAKVIGREFVSIDMIQDLVIAELEDKDSEVAKLYQEYRTQRDTGRDRESKETKYALKVLKGGDDSNQNGNVDGSSFGGKMGAILDNIMKKLALNYFMSKKSADNHIRNRIYSHDLSHYAAGDPNCLNIPTDYVSKHGMEVKQADIREPQSVATWCQLLAVQCQVQSLSQFGGVGFTHLDHSAVPYIRKSFRKKCFISWLFLHPEKFKGIDILKMYSTNHQEEISKGVYIVKSDLDVWLDKNKEEFYEEMGLKEEDFIFGNKEKIGEIIYNQAMLETLKEIKQAVEGLFHNLNILGRPNSNIRNIAI